MDMATFKTLEFTAIFGALGWFWWNQRQDRLRREQAEREDSKDKPTNAGEDAGTK